MICCYQLTKICGSRYGFAIASSAWALVILVRLQISQFRSLGKWVWTLCLPKSSRLFAVGSKEASFDELAWEPPCNGISSSTKISLNSCSHSGISESPHGFPRSIGGFLLIWFWDFVDLDFFSGFPDLSSTNSDTGTGEMSLSGASSLSRTEISSTVGEKGEDEEDEEVWLSCFMGVFEVDEDAEEELDKPGTTIGTKFSVMQIIRIPSFMRCGFWPLIHSWEYPFLSQSFPSDNTAGVLSRTVKVKNFSYSLTYTIASSCVCTSPLAVMTIVGLHDFVKVSISASLQSFLLIMCIDAPESTTNSRSSNFRVDASKHLFSDAVKNVALWCSFNFNTLLNSFHAASRAPCSCHSDSSWDRSSNFGALGLRWWGAPGQM